MAKRRKDRGQKQLWASVDAGNRLVPTVPEASEQPATSRGVAHRLEELKLVLCTVKDALDELERAVYQLEEDLKEGR